MRVLPEAIAAPPLARDDAATTEVDVPVTIDVLRNDVDPSGEQPRLTGEPGCAGGGKAAVTTDNRVTFTPPAGQAGRLQLHVSGHQLARSARQRQDRRQRDRAADDQQAAVASATTSFRSTSARRFEIVPLANDTDPDGPASALRVLSSTTPSLGRAERVGNVITFTAGNVTGPTTITYQVGDDDGGVSTGHVLIVISRARIRIPPIAVDDGRTIAGPGVADSVRRARQ